MNRQTWCLVTSSLTHILYHKRTSHSNTRELGCSHAYMKQAYHNTTLLYTDTSGICSRSSKYWTGLLGFAIDTLKLPTLDVFPGSITLRILAMYCSGGALALTFSWGEEMTRKKIMNKIIKMHSYKMFILFFCDLFYLPISSWNKPKVLSYYHSS